MSDNSPGRGSDQFNLRFPDGMRDRIREEAERNGRSMNAEIIARLSNSLGIAGIDGQLVDLASDYRRVSDRLNTLLPLIIQLDEADIAKLIERKQTIKLYHQINSLKNKNK